jgi:hypothetical protein
VILYHGSNVEVPAIDFAKCRPYRDFGKGFYLTSFQDQVKRMAARTSRIYGGSSVVSVYEYSECAAEDVCIRIFEKPSMEWARFVMNNRDRSFTDVASLECNLDNKYDIVVGPVADDDMTLLFRQFTEGLLSLDTLANEMEYRELTNQYSFHSDKAVALLTFQGVLNE